MGGGGTLFRGYDGGRKGAFVTLGRKVVLVFKKKNGRGWIILKKKKKAKRGAGRRILKKKPKNQGGEMPEGSRKQLAKKFS